MAEAGKVYRTRDEQIAYLKKMPYKELYDWLEQALARRDTGCIAFSDRDDFIEAIVDLVRKSSILKFHQRFRRAIKELLDEFSTQYADHTPEYLLRLAVLSGRLRVGRAQPRLVEYAKEDRLKVIVNGEDVHQTILRIIWGMGIVDSRTRSLFANELEKETSYSILCFNALYQSRFTDGLKYLPLMIKRASNEGWHDEFGRVFDRFIRSSNNAEFNAFARHLRKIIGKLNQEEFEVFLGILKGSKCNIIPNEIFRGRLKKAAICVQLEPRGDKRWDAADVRSIPQLKRVQLSFMPIWIDTRIQALPQRAQDIMPELIGVG